MKQKISAIYKLLAQIRDQKNLKQKDIAKRMGASDALISRIEKGSVNIKFNRFVDMCLALRMSPSDVLRKWEKTNNFEGIDTARRNGYYRTIDKMIKYGFGVELDTFMTLFERMIVEKKKDRAEARSKRKIRKYFPKVNI